MRGPHFVSMFDAVPEALAELKRKLQLSLHGVGKYRIAVMAEKQKMRNEEQFVAAAEMRNFLLQSFIELGGSFDLRANFKNQLTVSKLHMCKLAIKFGFYHSDVRNAQTAMFDIDMHALDELCTVLVRRLTTQHTHTRARTPTRARRHTARAGAHTHKTPHVGEVARREARHDESPSVALDVRHAKDLALSL
jgi:hypothetical protein